MHQSFSNPLRFTPILMEKIWGGQALKDVLQKKAPFEAKIGESWEISGWGDNQTVVSEGDFAGMSLGELFSRDPSGLAGASATGRKNFPLLFKFIDAASNLSVQVHPNKEQARIHNWGESGKTECWYVADAREGAEIIVGFKRPVSRAEVENAVKTGTLEQLLNYIPVFPGDVLFIPAGTVHAILEGALIYEVQEESDTTLRLYDWNRRAPDGSFRELHLPKALDILDYAGVGIHKPVPVLLRKTDEYRYESRCRCSNFALEQISFTADANVALESKNSFQVLSVIEGLLDLVCSEQSATRLSKGDSVLVPATVQNVSVIGFAGSTVLVTYVP